MMDSEKSAKSLEEAAREASERGSSAKAIGLYLKAERAYRSRGDYASASRSETLANIIDNDLRAWVED